MEDYTSIPLTGQAGEGKFMLLDSADVHHFEGRGLFFGSHGYAVISRKKIHLLAHRVILGAQKSQVIDHINGNRLDNRRVNLRFCTTAQNAANVSKRENRDHKGVFWDKSRSIWRVFLQVEDKMVYLGSFEDAQKGSEVYDAAALQSFGAFAKPNDPNAPTAYASAYLAEWFGPRWLVTSPSGEEFRLDTLKQFCRDNSLMHSNMILVSQGKQAKHKGWSCKRISNMPARSTVPNI